MALLGYTVGGRVGVVHEVLCNQQIAEYAALEYAVNFVSALGWDRVGQVGDNFSVFQSFAARRVSVGLKMQNRILRRLVYGCTGSRRTWYLCWVPGECNPADPSSRIRSVWGGGGATARRSWRPRVVGVWRWGAHNVSSAYMDPGTACYQTTARSCGVKDPDTRLGFGEWCVRNPAA